MAEQKVRANFIFEIMGRPPEHIVKSLDEYIEKIGKEPGIKVLNKKIHEPKLLDDENSKDLYTSFAEVEMEINNLSLVFSVIFNLLPARIEILEPSELRMKNFELNDIITELAVKLHKYDEIAKTVVIERNMMAARLREAQERISFLEKDGAGINEENKNPVKFEEKNQAKVKEVQKDSNKKPKEKAKKKKR